MLTYTCPTCLKNYEATIAQDNSIAYVDDNKRLVVQSGEVDCHSCQVTIKEAAEAKRAEIKAQNQS